MASLRRSKTLTPDGQTARFLYTIIKQLDLKTIDWNEVAGSLDITNGHAARMRFSRFKQHIEGTPGQARTPRPKKNRDKNGEKPTKGKGKSTKRKFEEDDAKDETLKGDAEQKDGIVKSELAAVVKEEAGVVIKPEPVVKNEPGLVGEVGESLVVQVKREWIESPPIFLNPTTPEMTMHSGAPQAPGPLSSTSGSPSKIAARPPPKGPPAPPPLATVSLADLQLIAKPRSIPTQQIIAQYPEPKYHLQTNYHPIPHPMAYPGPMAHMPRMIKMEPGMARHQQQQQQMPMSYPSVVVGVKREPVDFY